MADRVAPSRRDLGQVLRFLVVGGANTLLTYAVFILLGLVIEPWIAYTIAFALGLVWTSLGSSRLVFRARFSLRRVLLFAGAYLVVYAIGRLIILVIDPQGLVALALTSLVVLVVTTPLIFLIGRFIFDRPAAIAEQTTGAPES